MQKGYFWNWYKMMGIIKALKCCQNLYQVVVCPCAGSIHMFEIVKKCKISHPAQDQLSGERNRIVGPLVMENWRQLSFNYHQMPTLFFSELWNQYEPDHDKTCLMPQANNKGADQPAHPHSLTSTFVVHCLDSIISLASMYYMTLAFICCWAGWFEAYLVTNPSHDVVHILSVWIWQGWKG